MITDTVDPVDQAVGEIDFAMPFSMIVKALWTPAKILVVLALAIALVIGAGYLLWCVGQLRMQYRTGAASADVGNRPSVCKTDVLGEWDPA